MSRTLLAPTLLAGLAAALCACGTARRGEPFAGPLPVADPSVRHGQIVFMQHCHMCHPGGEGGLGPAINDKPLPGFLIKTQVRLGMGAMPEFSEDRIPSTDLDALVSYLSAMRHHE